MTVEHSPIPATDRLHARGDSAIRVFVLCTGRCGSQTFAEAFTAADNFTSGHETRTQVHPSLRFDYPDQHIEADNRLAWFLGELDKRFGDEAHYVHLQRDPEDVARSYAARWPKHVMLHDSSIVGGYAHGIFHRHDWPTSERLDLARSYVTTVTANIELFLRDRSHVHAAHVSTLPDDVARIWDAIGATGDLDRALTAASTVHNARRAPPSSHQQLRDLAQRWYGYSRSIAGHLRDRRRAG